MIKLHPAAAVEPPVESAAREDQDPGYPSPQEIAHLIKLESSISSMSSSRRPGTWRWLAKIGELLSGVRANAHVTIGELAEDLDVSPMKIERLELGLDRSTGATVESLLEYADHLGCHIEIKFRSRRDGAIIGMVSSADLDGPPPAKDLAP